MPNKLKLPFILNGGNKKSFRLLNDKEITQKSLKQSAGMLDYLQKLMFENNSLEKNNNLHYLKASETKKYYEKLKK